MGSAICFPTQCIIFTAVCLYAAIAVCSQEDTGVRVIPQSEIRKFIRTRLWNRRSPNSPFTWKLEPPVVYGDDIAVDSRTTDCVISTLSRLGFTVNRSKSFTGSQSFRESCGVFAFEGHDVTPVMFRLPFFKRGSFDASVYASFLGQINWLGDNSYHHSAAFHLATLRSYGFRNPIPFVTQREEFGIYTTNKHRYVYSAHIRWNADWQVTEERVQGIESRPPPKVELDSSSEEIKLAYLDKDGQLLTRKVIQPKKLELYRLDQWWRSRICEEVTWENNQASHIRPQETRLAPRWARRE